MADVKDEEAVSQDEFEGERVSGGLEDRSMKTRGRVLRWLGLAVLLAGLIGAFWFATLPPPLIVQGEVSSDRVDISSRVAARVEKLNVDVGDDVKKGDILAMLDSPQLVSARAAAAAALAVARASLARVETVRPENVAAQKAEVDAARADVTLALQTFNRQEELKRTGDTPQASVDQAQHNLDAATQRKEAAEANLQLTMEGASKEERDLAASQVKQAEATLGQRIVDVEEFAIRAPTAGQIITRVASLGENFSVGAPLFSMINVDDLWFTFNVREDLLHGLKIGDMLDVMIPALDSVTIPTRVTVINVQGEYAAWRATRATGNFDLRTFEVRARAERPIEGLRPGMSAIIAWNRGGQ
jgi:HlyD family secretion protein